MQEADAEIPQDNFRHNWLYSVVPASAGAAELGVYLAGYCKYCQSAFTVRLLQDGKPSYVTVSKLNIPRWGCINPTEN